MDTCRVNVHGTQSARLLEGAQAVWTLVAAVTHVDGGRPHPASPHTLAAPLHITVHVFGRVV